MPNEERKAKRKGKDARWNQSAIHSEKKLSMDSESKVEYRTESIGGGAARCERQESVMVLRSEQ